MNRSTHRGFPTMSHPMNHHYRQTQFLVSADEFHQLPPDQGHEVAFAGRSNAGKSSALNALVQQKNLARTSKTPGRTRLINVFQVTENHYLVDLPGYGYAKVTEAMRRHWQQVITRYLTERRALCGLMLLMDSRHPLTVLDQQLIDYCLHRSLPVHILLTKADKLTRSVATTTLREVRKKLPQESSVTVQLFSVPQRLGLEEAYAKLDEWLGYSLESAVTLLD